MNGYMITMSRGAVTIAGKGKSMSMGVEEAEWLHAMLGFWLMDMEDHTAEEKDDE